MRTSNLLAQGFLGGPGVGDWLFGRRLEPNALVSSAQNFVVFNVSRSLCKGRNIKVFTHSSCYTSSCESSPCHYYDFYKFETPVNKGSFECVSTRVLLLMHRFEAVQITECISGPYRIIETPKHKISMHLKYIINNLKEFYSDNKMIK